MSMRYREEGGVGRGKEKEKQDGGRVKKEAKERLLEVKETKWNLFVFPPPLAVFAEFQPQNTCMSEIVM